MEGILELPGVEPIQLFATVLCPAGARGFSPAFQIREHPIGRQSLVASCQGEFEVR
jgi:hypothetical protein